jgi:hypothetical protein
MMCSSTCILILGGVVWERACLGVHICRVGSVHAFHMGSSVCIMAYAATLLLSGGAKTFIQTLWALGRYDPPSPSTRVVQTVSPFRTSIEQYSTLTLYSDRKDLWRHATFVTRGQRARKEAMASKDCRAHRYIRAKDRVRGLPS